MGIFRNHKSFIKTNEHVSSTFPNVCLNCHLSFKKLHQENNHLCPNCGNPMIELSPKFKAPKKYDNDQWEKIKILIDYGFRFYTCYEIIEPNVYKSVDYPSTKKEAIEFVKKYKPNLDRNI
jgi:predicted RNA-binding Zn-ribbon protein involved in translation (DUF1610 family)